MAIIQFKEEAPSSYVLTGISCHERDYRLVWMLNLALYWNLEKQDELEIWKGGEAKHFSCFTYNEPDECAQYCLLSNKCGQDFLIPELIHFDYLLKIEQPAYYHSDALLQSLRKIPVIVAAMNIEQEKMKSKDRLVF